MQHFKDRNRSASFILTVSIASMAALCLAGSAQSQANPSLGQWSPSLSMPITSVHQALLPTGKVIMWDRYGPGTTYLFDPVTGNFTLSSQQAYNAFCTGETFLADGRLFIAGGHGGYAPDGVAIGLPNASIYDSVHDTWTQLPNMLNGRWYPTTTLLASGQDVLVVSGNVNDTTGINLQPEVWSAATQSWRELTNAQYLLSMYPYMFLTPNGQVFECGYLTQSLNIDTAGAGLLTNVAVSSAYRDYGSAVCYDDGKILILGGNDPCINTAEVINLNDPAPAWRTVAPMAVNRRMFDSTLLPDGTVLVTGGSSGPGNSNENFPVFTTELWNPTTETFTQLAPSTTTGDMTTYRGYHCNAMLLPDGRVMTASGDNPGDPNRGNPHYNFFSPPYLFNGARPNILFAPSEVTGGSAFTVLTPDAASITQVTLLRLSAVTHDFSTSQHINRANFSVTLDGLGLTVQAPGNAFTCTPGPYMLFLINGNGVPSVAAMIQIDLSPTPVGVGKSADSASVLRWTPCANAANYSVSRSTVSGGPYTPVATGLSAANFVDAGSYTDTGLSNGTTYYYVITSTDTSNNTFTSAEMAVTPQPVVSQFTISPNPLTGSLSSQGTITLSNTTSTNTVLTLTSSNASVAAPAVSTITIPAGSTIGTFPIATYPVLTNSSVQINATLNGVTSSVSLRVWFTSFSTFSVSPTSVLGGTPTTGTITLNGPAATGMTISLSSNSAAVSVPASVSVPTGASSVTFPITTSSPGASAITATITATISTATKTATLTVSPGTLTINPTPVTGGTSSQGTVTLNNASATDTVLMLTSDTASVATPTVSTITIPAGSISGTFPITTYPVLANASAQITAATANGVFASASMRVWFASFSTFSVSPTSVLGGTSATGTITLNGPAAAGMTISLSSNSAAVSVPASVSVTAGASSVTFPITTSSPGASPATATITATISTSTKTANLTVTPIGPGTLTINPTPVTGGMSSQGTVTLNSVNSTDTVLTLTSSNASMAAPAVSTITIPAGSTTGTFPITTYPVLANSSVQINASANGVTASASIRVYFTSFSTFTVSPTSVKGGISATGTITLNGPAAAGMTISLSSNSAAVSVPASVSVPTGASSVTFPITTSSPGASAITATITATISTSTKTATLKVTP